MTWEREQGRIAIDKLRIDGTSVAAIVGTRRINKNSSTGVRGVSVTKYGYRATIGFKHKKYHLGNFPTIEEAAAVRERADMEIYGPFLKWYEKCKKDPPSQ